MTKTPETKSASPQPATPTNVVSQEPAPSSSDRRRGGRLLLTMETAVPVLVRSGAELQWGIARNVSDGGMLVELQEPPPIGAPVEIQIFGIHGSTDAPDPAVVYGEVRHQIAWNFFEGDGRA